MKCPAPPMKNTEGARQLWHGLSIYLSTLDQKAPIDENGIPEAPPLPFILPPVPTDLSPKEQSAADLVKLHDLQLLLKNKTLALKDAKAQGKNQLLLTSKTSRIQEKKDILKQIKNSYEFVQINRIINNRNCDCDSSDDCSCDAESSHCETSSCSLSSLSEQSEQGSNSGNEQMPKEKSRVSSKIKE